MHLLRADFVRVRVTLQPIAVARHRALAKSIPAVSSTTPSPLKLGAGKAKPLLARQLLSSTILCFSNEFVTGTRPTWTSSIPHRLNAFSYWAFVTPRGTGMPAVPTSAGIVRSAPTALAKDSGWAIPCFSRQALRLAKNSGRAADPLMVPPPVDPHAASSTQLIPTTAIHPAQRMTENILAIESLVDTPSLDFIAICRSLRAVGYLRVLIKGGYFKDSPNESQHCLEADVILVRRHERPAVRIVRVPSPCICIVRADPQAFT